MSDLLADGAPLRRWLSEASLTTLAELTLAVRRELIERGMPGARALDEVAHGLKLQATAQRAVRDLAAEHSPAPIRSADCSTRSE